MNALHLEKIEQETGHKTLQEFLDSRSFLPIFFYSPYTLMTWLTHQNKSLYIARLGNESTLLIHKEKENDIRFLFAEPSESMIHEASAHFDPSFIGVNEIIDIKEGEGRYVQSTELTIDVAKVAGLGQKDLAKDYAKCAARHPDLRVESYTQDHFGKVRRFLEDWSHTRSEEKNKFAHTENDLHFLELYGTDPEAHGIIVSDEGKIVAISFYIRSLDGQAIGVINKCLRGYIQLGVFTSVERAKSMQARGFIRACIGSINNDFKKKFLPSSSFQKTFCREIMHKPGLEVSDKYLLRFF